MAVRLSNLGHFRSQRATVARKLATLNLGGNQPSEGTSIEGASASLNTKHGTVSLI
jgi:hypothetical protein